MRVGLRTRLSHAATATARPDRLQCFVSRRLWHHGGGSGSGRAIHSSPPCWFCFSCLSPWLGGANRRTVRNERIAGTATIHGRRPDANLPVASCEVVQEEPLEIKTQRDVTGKGPPIDHGISDPTLMHRARGDDVSLLTLGTTIIRNRWRIVRWMLVGAVAAAVPALSRPRPYLASTSF